MKIIICLLVVISCVSLAVVHASASDYVLGIYGNANMDDTIDGEDIAYVEGILEGTNEETELADANYDGEINEDDIDQIEMVISGEEKELTLVQYLVYPVRAGNSDEPIEEPVTISMPIETVAALGGTYGPYMLCALGEADKIIAVTANSRKRGEIRDLLEDKTAVGSSYVWDMEMILELNPDIVLAYACRDYSDYRKTLDAVGIPLVQMDFHVPEKYFREVGNLGWMLNKQEQAEELINFEQQHLGIIEEKVKDLSDNQKPRVYVENAQAYKTCGAYGGSGGLAVSLCGGINIFKDIETNADVEPETLLVRDPQVILEMIPQYSSKSSGSGIPCGYGATDTSQLEVLRTDIMSRPGFDQLEAVENERVYLITCDAASVHPSIFNSYVAKWLYPELFEDMDPVAVHEEWLQKFLGIEYQGVYAYPLS